MTRHEISHHIGAIDSALHLFNAKHIILSKIFLLLQHIARAIFQHHIGGIRVSGPEMVELTHHH